MANQSGVDSVRVYRLDKFIVPHTAREEFLARVKSIHSLLKTQPGFIQDFLLEQPIDERHFSLATLVEWQDQRSIAAARAEVKAEYDKTGFNPQQAMERLGITMELGNYTSVR
ncbi:antibiotic biosynthesis monooxygenase family protein [Cellvibrio japonicus]|uniref:Antibiotic biosynthesis monooxygenase family protein n=1 Tax=Cellvibrio japonicus (strain Ueda107) TaxID=498211 RepID=B3PD14_CELJU|nr:antibiotic biosynthesis monooxygenase [Cellvibrio japonicus]ACE84593.1 antibiotic biosynthesis monooxygenase family protein [Cellvibrio japonicus Ueda107]QEI11954.1 antibiotic biosynthesis monooxygenase [Cellvibrio japonicus]QEI15528.1 antibiotic biosynthesis monooxygenase [Cellvibrio japonicus]QEI19107.1 antibiotic biosynthesis monooxygenase [Cellvibrio japonicus]